MPKILIIEDEPELVKVLRSYLEKSNFDVITAYRGDSGLTAWEQQKPDLVLLDLNLPGMDGLEVLRQVRKFDKDVGIILLTAIVDKDVADEAFRMGADDYISKPVQVSFLESRIFLDIMARKIINKKYRNGGSVEQAGDDYFG
ncbi:MAG: response regulator [Bacteroidetes bacterium]|nr:response regulator [Bacteroidota bacterium]